MRTLERPTVISTHAFGFSLIELMIVVIIIAILASVAIPAFQKQIARAQVAGSLSELRSLSTAYEEEALRGSNNWSLAALGLDTEGLSGTTSRCALVLTPPDTTTGSGELACTLIGSPQINGFLLKLQRPSAQSRWACLTNLPELFRPTGCQSEAG